MAANKHANERVGDSVPLVESFTNGNGDVLNINLNRSQWNLIMGSLAIASGQVAIQRDYEQVYAISGLCNQIGARLGFGQQTATVGDLPPPTARAASA